MLTSAQTIQGLLAFSMAPGQQVKDRAEFHLEVQQNRRRIRSISRRTLSPHSKVVRMWDGITALALVFTAFITPFEVGFLSSSVNHRQAWLHS